MNTLVANLPASLANLVPGRAFSVVDDGKTFAQKLAAARRAAGIRKAELADRSGLSRSTLTHLERGTREPSLDSAIRLARALGIPLADLIPDAPASDPSPAPELPQGDAQHDADADPGPDGPG